jgi:hypothetical protein
MFSLGSESEKYGFCRSIGGSQAVSVNIEYEESDKEFTVELLELTRKISSVIKKYSNITKKEREDFCNSEVQQSTGFPLNMTLSKPNATSLP